MLRVAPGDVDIQRVRVARRRGQERAGRRRPERAAALLSEALGLWRGPLLADVPPSALIETHAEPGGGAVARPRPSCASRRTSPAAGRRRSYRNCAGSWRSTRCGSGCWALLMRALDEAGRRAEALEAYAQAQEVDRGRARRGPGQRAAAAVRGSCSRPTRRGASAPRCRGARPRAASAAARPRAADARGRRGVTGRRRCRRRTGAPPRPRQPRPAAGPARRPPAPPTRSRDEPPRRDRIGTIAIGTFAELASRPSPQQAGTAVPGHRTADPAARAASRRHRRLHRP